MFKQLAIAATAMLLPFAATAQVMAPASASLSYPLVDELLSSSYLPAAAAAQAPAIPVWASPDGRLLALVSMSHIEGAPAMPRAPLMGSGADWQIIDATSLLSSGLRWKFASGVSADLSIAQIRQSSGCGVAGSICADSSGHYQQHLAASLGMGWSGDASHYSYGMSWLRDDSSAAVGLPMFNGAGGVSLSGLSAAGTPFRMDSAHSVFARGQYLTQGGTHIELAASRGAAQLLPFALNGWTGASLETEQSTLSFGIGQGAIRGTVIGRVIDSVGSMLPGRRWTLLDIGVSWRTPWQGELSLGTQSYLAPQAESPKRDADVMSSRVPYVQYRQDL